jgi:hypothetical protein
LNAGSCMQHPEEKGTGIWYPRWDRAERRWLHAAPPKRRRLEFARFVRLAAHVWLHEPRGEGDWNSDTGSVRVVVHDGCMQHSPTRRGLESKFRFAGAPVRAVLHAVPPRRWGLESQQRLRGAPWLAIAACSTGDWNRESLRSPGNLWFAACSTPRRRGLECAEAGEIESGHAYCMQHPPGRRGLEYDYHDLVRPGAFGCMQHPPEEKGTGIRHLKPPSIR